MNRFVYIQDLAVKFSFDELELPIVIKFLIEQLMGLKKCYYNYFYYNLFIIRMISSKRLIVKGRII